MGWILHALLEEVLDAPEKNTVEHLSELVKSLNILGDKELKALGERGKEKKDTIQSVIISGGAEGMLDMPNYISKHLKIPSRLANVWQNAFSIDKHVPDSAFEASLAFAISSGLALASL